MIVKLVRKRTSEPSPEEEVTTEREKSPLMAGIEIALLTALVVFTNIMWPVGVAGWVFAVGVLLVWNTRTASDASRYPEILRDASVLFAYGAALVSFLLIFVAHLIPVLGWSGRYLIYFLFFWAMAKFYDWLDSDSVSSYKLTIRASKKKSKEKAKEVVEVQAAEAQTSTEPQIAETKVD